MTSPYAIALSHFAPFGPRTYVRLFEFYGDYASIWNANASELAALEIRDQVIDKFISWRRATDVETLVESVTKLGIDTVDQNDPRYPVALKTIFDPPIILYVRGKLPQTQQMIGVVGSRDATPYGLKTAKQFSHELARAGLVIVSGLARGIDVAAHAGAMTAAGKTIAVLAHGLEELKGSKRNFGEKIIAQGGAIITEQPPYMAALNYHFPIRNRIIAGLCRGVVIVEAELPSGTLHTAQAAINAHREVFSVPGPIDSPTSAGTNKLIQDGAQLVTNSNDILIGLNLPAAKPATEPALSPAPVPNPEAITTSPEHEQILAQLSSTAQHVDIIARQTGLSTPIVLGSLTILEIHGKVRHLGNMYYCLAYV
ncbi:MAG: processing protein, partial [Patescibacteria group bacterium]|jgi:DNA processing protein|nr:processing protein [Patescibacteria group bacterium]